MSKATKRKHVTKEVLDDYVLPEDNQKIVKVCNYIKKFLAFLYFLNVTENNILLLHYLQILGGKGNNLHEIETSEGEKYLVSMPTKFRKNVWIKRGDFVLIQPIEEGEKVKAEIVAILYAEQIKYIQSQGKW